MTCMPVIRLHEVVLEGRDLEIATACVARGFLRATKPKDGEAAYVWRMVCFQVSPYPRHHCMPMAADFNLPREYWEGSLEYASDRADRRRVRTKELDVIVDALCDTVPKDQWYGVKRWGSVFGVL